MTKISNQYSLTNILTADLANSRLGINNVSPAYSLDVTGTARTSTSTYLATASGFLGIGTTNVNTFGEKASILHNDVNTLLLQNSNVSDSGRSRLLFNFTNSSSALTISGFIEGGGSSSTSGYLAFQTNNSGSSEKMRILANGNVGIGTTTPTNKLEVNGNGYFGGALSSGSSITASGTVTANNLSVNSAVYTYNMTQFNYAASLTLTVPNALNSGSDNSLMRMYMVWVWGANGPTEAGCRVWMIAMNGGGTAHTVTQLLGRDANGGTGLSLARTSASEITISSNNNAFIKFVSIMQLMTYAGG